MEYQVQGSVLIDGEWVSRTADVYRIMARSQQQEDIEMQEPELKPRNEVPDLGILSRTLVPSPFYKFALSANIRHKELNDVVLIAEDAVHLKEICDYGHLRHVATKSDFNGQILAARVFGDPRQVRVNTSEQSPMLKRGPFHRGRRSTAGDEDITLPPEVIVLTLTSRTLMFLWAQQTHSGTVAFRQKTVRLPAAGTSRFDRPGTFLAVDPRCRAIAVAAPEGCFMLYKTKTMDLWRDETRGAPDELPIVDEALIPIQGRIMHMEFLSSGGDRDDSHIVLVFVLVHDGKTKLACYDWDYRSSLDDGSARKERYSVGYEDRDPALLIPLKRSPDFLLVYDQRISLYKHVLSGPPVPTRTKFHPHIIPPLRPGDGKSTPRWVQWDRAPRNPDFAKEAFYLAREDGRIAYAERDPAAGIETVKAGDWPYPIDTAFACLNVNNREFAQSYPDLLIAGGAGSDGHLCKVGAWPTEYSFTLQWPEHNTFAFLESIPNWAPLSDMSVTRLPGLHIPYERDRAAIFVANGKAPHGEISELRRGIKAIVDDSFPGMEGCTGVWIVDWGSQTFEDGGQEATRQYATFIVTLPPESLLIRVSRLLGGGGSSQSHVWSAWDNGAWEKIQIPDGHEPVEDGIIRDDETISACSWTDHYAVQITRNEARVLHRPRLDGVDFMSFPSPLLRAVTRSGFPFVAVAFREGDRTMLELARILDNGTFGKKAGESIRHELPCDPTCLELLNLDGLPHVFVGTIDCRIRLFKILETGSLVLAYDTLLERNPSGSQMVCESAALLTSRDRRVLVCGTRNGFLLSTVIHATDSRYNTLSTHLIRMGTTAARLTTSTTDSSTAFVACGSDFCRIRCSASNARPIDVDSVWFIDRQKPAYTQNSITAIDQLPLIPGPAYRGRDIGGFIFAASGDQMVFAQLDYNMSHDMPPLDPEESKTIPRKLVTAATPTKLMYLEGTLREMVVATVETKEERAPPDGYRVMHSSIKVRSPFDDLSGEEPKVKQEDLEASKSGLVVRELPLKHYERVHSFVEWTYTDERQKKHHFIIVGTGIAQGLGKEKGRRLFLRTGKCGVKLQHEKVFEHAAVRCIAIYDNTSIVQIHGSTLAMYEYEPTTGKWTQRGSKELPSAGVHLTVSHRYVYVSTTHDSHICYEVVIHDPQGERMVEFIQIFTDVRQRSSAHHLVLDVQSPSVPYASTDRLVLLTDKKCSVTGLLHSPDRTNKSTTETLFEACLPRSVIRIHRGDIRPPWRRPCKSHTEPFQGIPGVLVDDLLGACSDGTIYSFSILTSDARCLLRLIQNIIEAKQKRDPRLQYSIVKQRSSDIFNLLLNGAEGSQDGKIKARDVDPEEMKRGEAALRFKHIDGDLLTRFLEEDGNVEELVCDDTEGVKKLALSLAARVSGTLFRPEVAEISGEELEGDWDGVWTWVKTWLGEVLMPLL